jgi:hypothetical protein
MVIEVHTIPVEGYKVKPIDTRRQNNAHTAATQLLSPLDCLV